MARKWSEKVWVVVFLLIIFPPLGLYLLWRNEQVDASYAS